MDGADAVPSADPRNQLQVRQRVAQGGGRGDTWRRARPRPEPDTLQLPMSPTVLVGIQTVIRRENAGAAEVAAVLQTDPGLLATVLRLVNSPYYGLPQRITRPTAAVAYLGLSEVLRVVVTASILQAFGPSRHRALRPLWRHASHTALIAQALTRRTARWLSPVTSWTLGLLHDLGALARLVADPDAQIKIFNYAQDYRCLAEEAELVLGLTPSPVIGRRLALSWDLPPVFSLVLGDHRTGHPTTDATDDDTLHLHHVAVASALAELVSRPLREDVRHVLHEQCLDLLGLGGDELLGLIDLADSLSAEADAALAELVGSA